MTTEELLADLQAERAYSAELASKVQAQAGELHALADELELASDYRSLCEAKLKEFDPDIELPLRELEKMAHSAEARTLEAQTQARQMKTQLEVTEKELATARLKAETLQCQLAKEESARKSAEAYLTKLEFRVGKNSKKTNLLRRNHSLQNSLEKSERDKAILSESLEVESIEVQDLRRCVRELSLALDDEALRVGAEDSAALLDLSRLRQQLQHTEIAHSETADEVMAMGTSVKQMHAKLAETNEREQELAGHLEHLQEERDGLWRLVCDLIGENPNEMPLPPPGTPEAAQMIAGRRHSPSKGAPASDGSAALHHEDQSELRRELMEKRGELREAMAMHAELLSRVGLDQGRWAVMRDAVKELEGLKAELAQNTTRMRALEGAAPHRLPIPSENLWSRGGKKARLAPSGASTRVPGKGVEASRSATRS
ncbi:hypothetical protein CYMTET_50782 [Cymbomonas tetramitiformis]|uniref:Uncharacterized protein n=1 Tax=Cymbomonas tetramitiformis TaxID=36881 RepID=A0AAE0BMF6_9CHLO|nr:hypothetical protein CYMTET_50782 [Cymbomonas tetramitiformis]